MHAPHFHPTGNHHESVLDPASRDFYVDTLSLLSAADIPFLLGGAYAFARYTGIERHTKDLDVFVRAGDTERTLETMATAGYDTRLEFPHWLGKAYCGDNHLDVIFSSGNGVCQVDEAWFRHAEASDLFGVPVLLVPPEEMIWQKSLILERERYDGADVAHIIHCRAEQLDWERLVARFGRNWRVLASHLVMFGFIYPSERHRIPPALMHGLLERLRVELEDEPPTERVCNGTIVSRAQYLTDVQEWGYTDARLAHGHMNREQIDQWTRAIDAPECRSTG